MRTRSDGGHEEGQQTGDHGGSEDGGGTGVAGIVLAGASAVFTILVVAYVGWHLVMGPEPPSEPEATVVGTQTLPDGAVAVTVELRNPYDRGLARATVESACTTPPAEVSFSMVPADSTVTGTLVCPPGTTTPRVSVAGWVKE